ncbi:AAA family ATPase [Candidatus Woesearchaeota archaeon]|mgnify:FL=1|jgi:proteasome regulatory subunit|nr:AAA family ATPase [Candidatus Woesearchaeota archaeon]
MEFISKRGGDSDYSIIEENKKLKETVFSLKKELNSMKEPPLVVCDVVKMFKEKIIVRLSNGNSFFVNVSPNLIERLNVGDRVLAEQKSLTVVDTIGKSKQFGVENFVIMQKPDISWSEIGGLKNQIRELYEVIELPLKKPKLFKKMGIEPPKGVLLYGASGTGKTVLAKAIAASTNAAFIQIVGSELVQKFIGEGAKLVKDIFKLARENAPAIIFIDEIDSIASERVDIGTSGEREVQRTFMQLLNEIDGFNHLDNVKIIGATNRIDVLDQAIIRPGRLDRLVHIPLPEEKGRSEIFKVHTKNMNIKNVDFREVAALTNSFSGAEIKSVCTEAGYFAIREKRTYIDHKDFLVAINKVRKGDEIDEENPARMFG